MTTDAQLQHYQDQLKLSLWDEVVEALRIAVQNLDGRAKHSIIGDMLNETLTKIAAATDKPVPPSGPVVCGTDKGK